ncbi:unnamed protein product [Cladocopium goreaui]|uniref:Polyketide synthase PksN n=1 Tax=Cladocopium goreaui TaxID=2562237 RepID=A0A9P1DFH7_9DINO|nr:unnamed protein product [Cladocopium goreaui]
MGNACPHWTPAPAAKPNVVMVTAQEVRENGWLIIFGKVYNVKEYLGKHPGGADILLSVVGRDATVEFETMRHSQLALNQLEQLLVGVYDSSRSDAEMTDKSAHGNPKKLGLTGGRLTQKEGLQEKLWDVGERGFLPAVDPVKELPAPWDELVKIMDFVPSYSVQGRFREIADSELQDLPSSRQGIEEATKDLSEGELECLHSVLGYVCLAYIHSPPDVYEQDADETVNIMGRLESAELRLPKWLSMPWLSVSQTLGRRPMLDYAGCVLNNWERIDPERPLKPSNLRLLRRFTGLVDEEWFFKTHIIIEAEGSHVVSSLVAISNAVQSNDERSLLEELRSLEENLWRLSSVCLPIMFARSPQDHSLLCEPFLFFFRLRAYIKSVDVKMVGEDDELEEYHLHGPSGAMSTILPSVDALLGIRNTSANLREAVKTFENYVPRDHRDFLDHLRNAPESVKSFIESRRHSIDEGTWFALAAAFNSCISRVLDFRWRHWSFVEQFIVRPSSSKAAASASASVCPMMERERSERPQPVGTGGTTFDYLQQHITDSQMARIPLGVVEMSLLKTPEVAKIFRPQMPNVPLLDGSLWDVGGPNGFVANRDGLLPGWGPFFQGPFPGCEALQQLVAMIPTFCFTYPGLEHVEENRGFAHPFVSKCEALKEPLLELSAVAATMGILDLEHCWLLLSFVVSAYHTANRTVAPLAATCPVTGSAGAQCPAKGKPTEALRETALRLLPDWLKSIVLHFEVLVGREWHGAPEYSELVLNNWKIHPKDLAKLKDDFVLSRDTVHLVQPIARFIATPDEEWHRKLHLVLEAEGGRAVSTAHSNITPAISARDNGAVIGALNQLAADVDSLSEFQMRQFDQKDSRGEALLMQRLRAFVAEDLSEEDYAVWVYTGGSSPLLPAMHAILGLRKLDGISGPLQEHWQMQGRQCMPKSHRNFLENLEHGVSVRAYCLREWRKVPVEGIAALEDAFNNCIESLLKYCSLRQRLVSRMFPDVSRIRRLSAEQEQVIRSGRLALLQMRRVADAHRMHLTKPPVPVPSL